MMVWPVLALGSTVKVPAHNLLAPVLAAVIAAARVILGVCGVFRSTWLAGITFTPWSRQSVFGFILIRTLLCASILTSAEHQKLRACSRILNARCRSGYSGETCVMRCFILTPHLSRFILSLTIPQFILNCGIRVQARV